MQSESTFKRMDGVAAHPLAELLACPPETGGLITASARSLEFDAGQIIFRQFDRCQGLYLIVAGQLVRRTERLETRLTLGVARPGDLVELAAALGESPHTYSLVAQTGGSLLMLPMSSLQQAFQAFPPLRMRLLEELAREVSRAYHSCSLTNGLRARRRGVRPPAA